MLDYRLTLTVAGCIAVFCSSIALGSVEQCGEEEIHGTHLHTCEKWFFVQVVGDPQADESSTKLPCGEDELEPCPTLFAALHSATKWKRATADNDCLTHAWITILLKGDVNCSVPLHVRVLEKAERAFKFNISRVTIRPANRTLCPTIRLTTASSKPVPLKFSKASAVRLSGLEFVSTIVYLVIQKARLFHVDRCKFSIKAESMNMLKHVTSVTFSSDVFFTHCVFELMAGEARPVIPDGASIVNSWIKPVFNAVISSTTTAGIISDTDTFRQWAAGEPVICRAYAKEKAHSVCGAESSENCADSGSSGSSRWNMALVVYDCTFRNLGRRFVMDRPYLVSTDRTKGSALTIFFDCEARHRTVIIDQCLFVNNMHPRDSPLMLQFNTHHIQNNPHCRNGSITMNNMVYVTNSEFRNNSALLGGAVSVIILDHSYFNNVKFENNTFADNKARQQGGAVAVYFAIVTVTTNCFWASNNNTFLRNSVLFPVNPGSAVYVYAASESITFNYQTYFREQQGLNTSEADGYLRRCHKETSVLMEDTTFTGNLGNGAFFARNVDAIFRGKSVVSSSTGTGIVVSCATLKFRGGPVNIVNNTGKLAGAFKATEFARILFQVEMSQVTIVNNTAEDGGAGLLTADPTSGSPSFDESLYYTGNTVDNTHRCPMEFEDKLTLQQAKALLDENSQATKCPAILVSSWENCFPQFNPLDHPDQYPNASKVAANKTTRPFCLPYVSPMYNYNSTAHPECSIHLNMLHGVDIFHQDDICYSSCNDMHVINKPDMFSTRVKTQGAWLVFNSTTTACYRKFRGRVYYYRKNCTRETLTKHMMHRLEDQDLPWTDCALFRQVLMHLRYKSSFAPVLPGLKFVLVPWGGTRHGWMSYMEQHLKARAREDDGLLEEHALASCFFTNITFPFKSDESLSAITLHPASGEEFSLSVQVLDEVMNIRTKVISIKVVADKDDVLLGYNGIQYGRGEEVRFSSAHAIRSLSLLGLTNSTGYILVTKIGAIVMRMPEKGMLALKIPFKIRRCHLGFRAPSLEEDVITYVTNSTRARSKGIISRYRYTRQSGAEVEQILSPLMCQCPADAKPVDPGVQSCKEGKSINVKSGYWAGPANHHTIPFLERRATFKNYTLEEFEVEKHGDPFGYSDQGTPFGTATCDNGLCNSSRKWTMEEDQDPCKSGMDRNGVLCGACSVDTYNIVASEACSSCDGATTMHVALYVFLMFLVTFVIFCLLLLLNVGLNPTMDSWLFFMQATFYLFPDETNLSDAYLSFLSLGLGNICLTPPITRLAAKALLLAQPLFLYFFIVLLWFCITFRLFIVHLQKLQRRQALAYVVWFIVVLSSSNMAYIAVTILTSVKLSNGKRVVLVDGAVAYFDDQHKPFGVLAIIVLICFVLPPPVILTVPYLRGLPVFRRFVDAALSSYEDHVPWWAAYNLVRRLLLALLQGAVVDGQSRRGFIALASIMLLTIHGLVRPFKRKTKLWIFSDVDNKFELMLLIGFCSLCILRLWAVHEEVFPGHYTARPQDTYIPICLTITVISLLLAITRFLLSWLATYRQTQRKKLTAADFEEDEDEMKRHLARLGSHPSTPYDIGCVNDSSGVANSAALPRSNSSEQAQLDRCNVPCGLREPLLLDAVLNPNGKDWSNEKI
ncbi:uncharacterized protein LOC135808417 [Sycon ciliatum]|uniref:uncharacterized protein LOC135808417 n=1 Tax=Sycon ciliatum TaxID=27933 RepID=UPI0031F669BF